MSRQCGLMRLRVLALITLVGLVGVAAQSNGPVRHAPRFWNDRELADWATPIAALGVRPSHYSEREYYAAPEAEWVRTYPVYFPGREPAGYWEYCHGSIDEWDDIGIKPNYQVEEDAAVEYATRRWGKKLTDFGAFLATYPMLGATHPVGKRILQEIDKFRKLTLPEGVWFRGRRIDAAGRKFTPDDMRVPDPSNVAIGVGRFNHHGQPHWYLAEHERTALEEVLDPGEN